jgi:four helix bundle protein
MGARRFQELRCWQLANTIRQEIAAICDTEVVAGDRNFCDDFRDAAGSVCRNISEGFGRFESGDIVKFFRYALASLAEVQDGLEECLIRKFIDRSSFDRLWDMSEHTKASSLKFIAPHVARRRANSRRRRSRCRKTR